LETPFEPVSLLDPTAIKLETPSMISVLDPNAGFKFDDPSANPFSNINIPKNPPSLINLGPYSEQQRRRLSPTPGIKYDDDDSDDDAIKKDEDDVLALEDILNREYGQTEVERNQKKLEKERQKLEKERQKQERLKQKQLEKERQKQEKERQKLENLKNRGLIKLVSGGDGVSNMPTTLPSSTSSSKSTWVERPEGAPHGAQPQQPWGAHPEEPAWGQQTQQQWGAHPEELGLIENKGFMGEELK
jgi:hypothetical protein